MKGFKNEVDIYLNIENVLWIFLILSPFLLEDSVINENIKFQYFDCFKTLPFFGLLGLIMVLWVLKSNLNTRMFIFKWFFPVCLWISLFLPHEGNSDLAIFIIVIYFGLILFSVIELLKSDKHNSETNQGLISDDPIESSEENDSFGRKDYAKSIVSEIRKTVNKRAFNIAITGAWGSGKTSFLNLIKGEMNKTENYEKVKFITVNYNPWDFKEDKIIGLDLLKTISHELANEKELQEKFKGLMISLQGMNQSPWYKVIPYFLSGYSKEKSINEYRKEIGKALQDQNKKLIIFLDDLDRLDGEEILEVFKTIRNSFDIANTFFILGFDIEYVAEQIKDKVKGTENQDRAIEYLDKIFQMRLNMPSNEDFDIIRYLENNIGLVLDTYLKFYMSRNLKGINIRNAISIINAIKTIDTSTESNQDYNINAKLLIQFIALKHPKVYGFMAYNYKDVFTDDVKNKIINLGQKSHPINISFHYLKDVKISDFDDEKVKLILYTLYYMIHHNSTTLSESEYYAYFKFKTPDHLISRTGLFVAIGNCDQDFINSHTETIKETDLYDNLELAAKDYKKLENNQVDFIVRNLIIYHAKLLNSEPTLRRLLKTNIFDFPHNTIIGNSDIYKEKSFSEYISSFNVNTQFIFRAKFWYLEDDSLTKLEGAFDGFLKDTNPECGYVFELLYVQIWPKHLEFIFPNKINLVNLFKDTILTKIQSYFETDPINCIKPFVFANGSGENGFSYNSVLGSVDFIKSKLNPDDMKQKELIRWLSSGSFEGYSIFHELDYTLVFGEEYDSTTTVFSTM